jgi:hypothetical protein
MLKAGELARDVVRTSTFLQMQYAICVQARCLLERNNDSAE